MPSARRTWSARGWAAVRGCVTPLIERHPSHERTPQRRGSGHLRRPVRDGRSGRRVRRSAAPADDGKRPEGLYGTKDPKFDGVWRQSLALLAQDAVG